MYKQASMVKSLENENEKIEKLFFDLASESRLGILRELSQKSLKMQEIGRILDLSATETFRQLQRLSDDLIISKNVEGNYTLTCYGKFVLFLCPSFEVLLKHKRYFLEHDVWQLPPQFLYRIGELSNAELKLEIPENLNHVEEMIQNAEEYLWILTNRILGAHSRAMVERCGHGLKYRSLFHQDLLASIASVPEIEHCIERRYLPQTPGIVVITEKEAAISLPFIDGKSDYAGFFGKDLGFKNWVIDLYLHYWTQGKPWHIGTTKE
jgi:predicted transcriptional regulator